MRREFIACRSRRTAKRRVPWAAHIAKCDGGFIAFKSVADWLTWRNQR